MRLYQQKSCKLWQNRDRAAAGLIGLQFEKLIDGEAPLRAINDEEAELHKHNVLLCTDCD